MQDLTIFNNSQFGDVRATDIDGEPWFVGKDVATALGYSNTKDAIIRHVDPEDKRGSRFTTPSGEQQFTVINESGLYALVFSSKLKTAKEFKHWVTSEVLPSIRKTGSYSMMPKDFPSALRAYADEIEKNNQLTAEVKTLTPYKNYVDEILSSPRTLTITQIAADYGISAQKLNKLLSEAKVQRKVNGQWVLYQKYMGNGYTESETIQIVRSDGKKDAVMQTKWTQNGRLLIHNILAQKGVHV